MWILASGARWRDLLTYFGNWNSIYHKFRQWCECGLFERLLKIVNADANNFTLLELDSTFCKVHQSACSGLKAQAIGASRGGKNTKVHVLINERMQVLNVVLTGGHMPTKLILAIKFVVILKNTERKFAFLINLTPRRNTPLTLTFTKDAILSSGSFSGLKIFAMLLFVCFLNFVLLASVIIHFLFTNSP